MLKKLKRIEKIQQKALEQGNVTLTHFFFLLILLGKAFLQSFWQMWQYRNDKLVVLMNILHCAVHCALCTMHCALSPSFTFLLSVPLVTILPVLFSLSISLSFSLSLCILFLRAAALLIFSASRNSLASSFDLLNCWIAAISLNFSEFSARYLAHLSALFCTILFDLKEGTDQEM